MIWWQSQITIQKNDISKSKYKLVRKTTNRLQQQQQELEGNRTYNVDSIGLNNQRALRFYFTKRVNQFTLINVNDWSTKIFNVNHVSSHFDGLYKCIKWIDKIFPMITSHWLIIASRRFGSQNNKFNWNWNAHQKWTTVDKRFAYGQKSHLLMDI